MKNILFRVHPVYDSTVVQSSWYTYIENSFKTESKVNVSEIWKKWNVDLKGRKRKKDRKDRKEQKSTNRTWSMTGSLIFFEYRENLFEANLWWIFFKKLEINDYFSKEKRREKKDMEKKRKRKYYKSKCRLQRKIIYASRGNELDANLNWTFQMKERNDY